MKNMNFKESKLMLTAHTGSISRVPARKTNKRLLAALLVCVVAVLVAMTIAATAHGQGAICEAACEPSQEVGEAPAHPALVYLPIVRK